MNASDREILVLPRQLLPTRDRFIRADAAKELITLWSPMWNGCPGLSRRHVLIEFSQSLAF